MKYTRVGVGDIFIAKIDPGERLPESLIRVSPRRLFVNSCN